MTAARFILIASVIAGSAGAARAADNNGIELELCIQTARDADATCGKLTNDPAQRLECFRKARGAQLDCLEHALAEAAPGAAISADHSGASRFEPPASTGSADASSRVQGNTQETPQESKAPQDTAGDTARSSVAHSTQAAPEPTATPAPESTTAAAPSDPPKDTPKDPPKDQAEDQAKDEIKNAAKIDAKPSEAQADSQAKPPARPQVRLPESNWVVSETTSPVDYSTLLTAVIRPTSSSPGGPVSLAIRCRGGQTALLIRTEGTWHATRRNALPVDFQINDQPAARQNWNLAADAKIANYADDTVELLKSIPNGARLTVSVVDGADARPQATFLLGGWDAIRKRVETACKWPKATDEASSGKR
jgi:Type VI secretion system VasI, EvfG, VC_A0118